MKLHQKLFFLFLFFSTLFSCTTSKKLNTPASVSIIGNKRFYLLEADSIENNIDSYALLKLSFYGKEFCSNAYLKADSNGIFLSLLNDFGTNTGTFVYDGKNAAFSSPIFPEGAVKPEYIAAELQCAFYKAESLFQMLQTSGLTFMEEKQENEFIRKVLNKKKCVLEIIKTPKATKIINHLRNYEYLLEEAAE